MEVVTTLRSFEVGLIFLYKGVIASLFERGFFLIKKWSGVYKKFKKRWLKRGQRKV